MSAAVEAHGVMKRYGALVAVQDLTFTAAQGEVLGVLGPNGAGKTTAIRVLTTILDATQGTFAVAGVPQTKPTEIRRRIGVLPESAGYPERQTGEEFLRYHARLYGHSRPSSAETARALLAEVGLAERGGSLISDLQPRHASAARHREGAGQRPPRPLPRRADARPRPGRPAAGPEHVRRAAEEREATVLLSTHLLAEVEETCSRVLILNRGRSRPRGRCPGSFAELALPGARSSASRAEDLDAAKQALTAAGIAVESVELEGARLSDAFLAMTESD